jgi:acyl dehydratase
MEGAGAVAVRAYTLTAHNTATDSTNKIHDDTVARQYGFAGGLVPGVVVHAYMTHPAVEEWGVEWLTHGTIDARFVEPVYDGETIVVEPTDTNGLSVTKPSGARAAFATIGTDDSPAPDVKRWSHLPLPAKAERPPATEEVFAATPVLGALDVHFRLDLAHLYLEAIGETLPLYWETGVAHPGWLIAQANYVLSSNVVLGPWIHVSSEVRYLGLVHDGDLISTRAAVTRTFERKGHRFVDLDVVIVNGAERPVMQARHVAIYQPRRVED